MGLPASGKTTLARAISKKLKAVHLSSDAIRSNLNKRKQYDNRSKESVYDEMYRLAAENLRKGDQVILDATFHLACRRQRFISLAEQTGKSYLLILVKAGLETTLQRLAKSRPDSEADLTVYFRLLEEYEPPAQIFQIIDTGTAKPLDLIVEEIINHDL